MPSSNPVLSENTFSHFQQQQATSGSFMTIDGAVNKTALLLLLIVASAAWSWSLYLSQNAFYMPVLLGGTILGLVLALVTIFKKEWSPVTAPLYAVFEGAALGALSGFFNEAYPGIVIEAVLLTFGTLGVLLLAYKSKLIQVTDNFRLGVVAATGGIALVYVLTFILGFLGIRVPYIHDSGLIGIGFSVFVVIIASLNLVLDFDFIEKGANLKAPKYMEWFAAFALMVTLVWLYVEFLRLLAKLRSRD
ncbi:MAG TPA: Bax inhibitor-1/YccA family protein [Candidatus Norongarragalinales archaeon]|nr:Bax inhibitor-1/YccA family protein [Candidatus Norongarragalinales archaeon]